MIDGLLVAPANASAALRSAAGVGDELAHLPGVPGRSDAALAAVRVA